MSRALPIRQKQVTALAKGAAKAGCVAEVKIGDVVVRLVPTNLAQPERPIDDPDSFETFEQYLAWRDRKDAREAGRLAIDPRRPFRPFQPGDDQWVRR